MVDEWVRRSQVWVNAKYGAVPGYVKCPETGLTGWSTMFSLTRALQHELGITALSDNFGDGTMSRFTTQVGQLGPNSSADFVAIFQAALWCKGYSGGEIDGAWGPQTATASRYMQEHMGIASSDGSVSAKVMKATLTMDAYVRVGAGTDEVREVQQWLNANYHLRRDYYIIPCDGVYSRSVQKGLMIALQLELGIPDGEATGTFGTGTISRLKGLPQYKLSDSSPFIRFFQAGLRFNRRPEVPFSEYFDIPTQYATFQFQMFASIPDTGKADYTTWAELLVSTGDTERAVTGCDTSTPLDAAKVQTIKSEGYTKVGRYINGPTKRLLYPEFDHAFDAGLELFFLYQEFNNAPGYFSRSQGEEQGVAAARRAREIGLRDGTIIHFSVDYDANESDIVAAVIPFFEGVSAGLQQSRSRVYRVGIYAPRYVCQRIFDAQLAEAVFVSGMSRGYSGNLGFPLPEAWAYNQIEELPSVGVGTGALGIDRNAVSPRAVSYGRSDIDQVASESIAGVEAYSQISVWMADQLFAAEAASLSRATWPDVVAIVDDFVWFGIARHRYWGEIFKAYTPLAEWQLAATGQTATASRVEAARAAYQAPSEAVLPPSAWYSGDFQHLAATVRGYYTWGTVADDDADTVGIGDHGGWALDLVTLWDDYVNARRADSSLAGKAEDWIAANFGGPGTQFSAEDLIADIDGYLAVRYSVGSAGTVDGFRRVLSRFESVGSQASARYAEFIALRFLNSSSVARSAVQHLFQSKAPWVNVPVQQFLNTRLPGEGGGAGDPTGSELAGELLAVSNGFVRSLWAKAGLQV